jgi:hypothetical protein
MQNRGKMKMKTVKWKRSNTQTTTRTKGGNGQQGSASGNGQRERGAKKKTQSLLFKLRTVRAASERGKLRVGVKPKGRGHSQNKGPRNPSVFFLVNFVM